MATKCPKRKKPLINLIIKGQEKWCKNCNFQLVKREEDGRLSFWMPPLKIDKNGNKRLPDGWSFEDIPDIVAFKNIDRDSELSLKLT